MIKRILIANRGEIAVRIARTCKSMNIEVIAIYSEADKNALHVRKADKAIYIGESLAENSYLNYKKIIKIALENKVDAVHPGYGFLSENPDFARALEKNNIRFIGPSVTSMKSMSLKNDARNMMEEADVPVLSGFSADGLSKKEIIKKCENIGFPLIIKASAGGGGKGMHVINKKEEIIIKFEGAKREALSSFGNNSILIEKYLQNPRHIEVQILADNYGNIHTLSDRDCSIQRRHQKVIEEAPATNISQEIRKEMAFQAKQVAKNISYSGAGTIEFLLENNKFYFMEMNTRLQVEHPVTELILGIDLVELQIKVANNEEIKSLPNLIKGHAIEARVYAENPEKDFQPSPGRILEFNSPKKDYLRLDTGYLANDEVSSYYDPMVAKIIAYGENRNDALKKLSFALQNTQLIGIKNNIDFLNKILKVPAFSKKNINTDFINKYWKSLVPSVESRNNLIQAALFLYVKARNSSHIDEKSSPWKNVNNWRHLENSYENINILCDKEIYNYKVKMIDQDHALVTNNDASYINTFKFISKNGHNNIQLICNNNKIDVFFVKLNNEDMYINQNGYSLNLNIRDKYHLELEEESSLGSMDSPVPGKIAKIFVKNKQIVKKGDILVIVEAMKMEHSILAPFSGRVLKVNTKEGDQVDEGFAVVEMEVN